MAMFFFNKLRRKANTSGVGASAKGSPKTSRTLLDLPNEILNDIFELVVVHRDRQTGQPLPIPLRSFVVFTRRHLRAMKTCKSFHNTMPPTFFGLNTFSTDCKLDDPDLTPTRRDTLGRFTIGMGLEVVHQEYGIYIRSSMLLPPKPCRPYIRQITISIELTHHQKKQMEGKDVHDCTAGLPAMRWFSKEEYPLLEQTTFLLKETPEFAGPNSPYY